MCVVKHDRLGGFNLELCKCGHLITEHGSRTTKVGDKLLREPHHGGCCAGSCQCKRFTFHRFVSIEEAADGVRLSRHIVGARDPDREWIEADRTPGSIRPRGGADGLG